MVNGGKPTRKQPPFKKHWQRRPKRFKRSHWQRRPKDKKKVATATEEVREPCPYISSKLISRSTRRNTSSSSSWWKKMATKMATKIMKMATEIIKMPQQELDLMTLASTLLYTATLCTLRCSTLLYLLLYCARQPPPSPPQQPISASHQQTRIAREADPDKEGRLGDKHIITASANGTLYSSGLKQDTPWLCTPRVTISTS